MSHLTTGSWVLLWSQLHGPLLSAIGAAHSKPHCSNPSNWHMLCLTKPQVVEFSSGVSYMDHFYQLSELLTVSPILRKEYSFGIHGNPVDTPYRVSGNFTKVRSEDLPLGYCWSRLCQWEVQESQKWGSSFGVLLICTVSMGTSQMTKGRVSLWGITDPYRVNEKFRKVKSEDLPLGYFWSVPPQWELHKS